MVSLINSRTLVVAAATIGFLAVAGFAQAAVTVDNVVLDGTQPFDAGSTIRADVFITTDGNNDVESIAYRYPNATGMDAQWRCFNVNPNQTQASPLGGWVVDAEFKAAASGGLYNLEVGTHGTDGNPEDNQCLTSADDTTLFANYVEVRGTNSSTSGNTGGGSGTVNDGFEDLLERLGDAISLLMGKYPTTTPPVVVPTPTKCQELASKLIGTQDDVYNDSNVRLQGFLLSEGESIPALAAGASFGFKGPQTRIALAHFKNVKQCAY